MTSGLIGPNALLQLVPVLEAESPGLSARLFASACASMPKTLGMIPEEPVARVHQELRRRLPTRAPALAAEAGRRTADYILAHRIPPPAQWLLRALPPQLSAPLLTRAIARNAWTFAGSGSFRIVSVRPVLIEIGANPVIRGECADHPVCHWHAGVFQRLFQVLVDPRITATETCCGAMGAVACRFRVSRPVGSEQTTADQTLTTLKAADRLR